MLQSNISDRWLSLLGLGFLVTLYVFFSEVQQSDFTLMMVLVSMLFGIYTLFAFKPISSRGLQIGIAIAILARIMTLFFFPNLSDDIHRFIWDGMCWQQGINPFALTPTQMLDSHSLTSEYTQLYPLLNSKDYFTIYPPICQLFFWLSVIFPFDISPHIILKSLFLVVEISTLFVATRLCGLLSIEKSKVLIYALNPLIIIELCGNLHFEAVMVMFIIVMLYFLQKNKLTLSGIAYGLAISTKLVPLVFGPLLVCYLGLKRGVKFFIPAGIVTVASFAFMLQGHISSILSSTNLYFQKFEFNASIYYALRELGIWLTTYNQIRILGPVLALIAFVWIVYYSSRKKNHSEYRRLIETAILVFTCYLALATTIHPWYLSTLVLLSVFSNYRFVILWSFLIFLSYSAYQFEPIKEVELLLVLEYGLVVAYAYYEISLYQEKSL